MNAVFISEKEFENMVMRTYTTGISLSHYPQNERGMVKKKLASIVQQLSDVNTKHCNQHAEAVVNHLLENDIEDQCISDPLIRKKSGKGKYGVNALMKEIGNASNHLHSGSHQLLSSSKGYIDRINKVQQIFNWMSDEEFTKFVLWNRSTYANSYFASKWKVSFWYVDNLMRGVHGKYFSSIAYLPCFLRKIRKIEFLDGIETLKRSILAAATDHLTDNQHKFLKRLDKLSKLIKLSEMDLGIIPTGWKHLKLWVDAHGFHNSWTSVFRSILAQVYLKDYKRMIEKVKTAKVKELLKIPFQGAIQKIRKNESQTKEDQIRKSNQGTRLPYLMVSGPKYVIRRENNQEALKKLIEDGYFELKFKFLDDKWKDAIVVRIRPSRKMRSIIREEIELKSMIVLPPRSNDVDIQLIFSGPADVFVATDHLKKKLLKPKPNPKIERIDTIGIDVNRCGEYAVVSNIDVDMPQEIMKQSKRWDKALETIGYLQSLAEKVSNRWKVKIYGHQINDLHKRKKNLRKDYHLRLANWVGQQIVGTGASKLVIEDLDVRTYGTRGALGRAIESMTDENSLYAREVLAVQKYSNKDVVLQKVSPYNSSRIHVDCGGRLMRDKDNYDIAPCKRCAKKINTHKNAAIYLVRSTKS